MKLEIVREAMQCIGRSPVLGFDGSGLGQGRMGLHKNDVLLRTVFPVSGYGDDTREALLTWALQNRIPPSLRIL
jgi:hypothetical protein